MRARTQSGFLLIIIINKTNKNNPVGEKQTGKAGQGRAGQGSTQHKRRPKKGANEEGNEGEQLGKMN